MASPPFGNWVVNWNPRSLPGLCVEGPAGHHPAGWPALALVPPARSVVVKGLGFRSDGRPWSHLPEGKVRSTAAQPGRGQAQGGIREQVVRGMNQIAAA